MFKIVESIELDNYDQKIGKRPEVRIPVIINIDQIQCVRPCYGKEQCIIQLAGGFSIFVDGTLDSVLEVLNSMPVEA